MQISEKSQIFFMKLWYNMRKGQSQGSIQTDAMHARASALPG